jgi:hypothetical protein
LSLSRINFGSGSKAGDQGTLSNLEEIDASGALEDEEELVNNDD